jgi:hypothetical protein
MPRAQKNKNFVLHPNEKRYIIFILVNSLRFTGNLEAE